MTIYTCPMHPGVQQDTPGKCPKCGGMDLVPQESLKLAADKSTKGIAQYKPLFIIVGLIALASIASAWDIQSGIAWLNAMYNFMAGFFLVFSGFKLLDVKGFAEGYSQYDLLAKHWHGYGLLYPFIELALGLGYILIPTSIALNMITVVLMVFSAAGVSIKIAKKEKFQCACLGTFIDVPLTYITIIEDIGMAIMAGSMLVTLYF
jgi:hypothetical protein